MGTRNHAIVSLLAVVSLCLAVGSAVSGAPSSTGGPDRITEGMLQALDKEGKPLGPCPLEHTDVEAEVAGNLSRVVVTQHFTNPYKDKIEAVYTFPLGADAAVTDMTMTIGDRTIRGQIKPREEAREIYEQAKAAGHVASLLDQERPNIFTQAVANIEPGVKIEIRITYTETLKWEDGTYSFVFPMVVGPRYIPGAPAGGPGPNPPPVPMRGGDAAVEKDGAKPAEGNEGKAGTGWAKDTDQVPDASKITPPVTPEGTRAGHDISVRVMIDAGMEIRRIESKQHEITTRYLDTGSTRAVVELARKDVIPNKDFVLDFSTSSPSIQEGVLSTTDDRGGYFMVVLQPPGKVQPKDIVPRELIFVIDTSGSQSGFPLETSKKLMARAIDSLREKDTFNIITFAGSTEIWRDAPVANTSENRAAAHEYLKSLRGAGGTEMMKAINTALGGEHDAGKVRIVAFLTDGYVGNDMAIIDAVQKNAKTTRVFSFGIGTGVNRYLLDGMAREGRGEVEYVLNQSMSDAAADRFYERISAPVLTDVALDWGDLKNVVEAEEVYPRRIPDLFSVKPLVVFGRYKPGAGDTTGEFVIRAQAGSGPFERRVRVTLPASEGGGRVVAPMWARAKVDWLMGQDLLNAQQGKPDSEIKRQVVELGMGYRLLTQYTSFVAVEERTVTVGGKPRTVAVPVEMPEGVSYEGVFGEGGNAGPGGPMAAAPMARLRFMGTAAAGRGGSGQLPTAVPMQDAGRAKNEKVSKEDYDEPATRHEAEEQIKKDEKLTDEQKRQKLVEMKLSAELQGLAAKLDASGNYSSGNVVVSGGRVEVEIYLDNLDAGTLEALEKLGFKKSLDAPAVKMVMGSIAVSKLVDLVQVSAVRRVKAPNLMQ